MQLFQIISWNHSSALCVTYSLLGTLHLNKFAARSRLDSVVLPNAQIASLKRKRIVNRLCLGFTREKRRCFQFSRLKDTIQGISIQDLEEQLHILETQVVVTCPSRRSVELSRRLSNNAQNYLRSSCGFSAHDLTELSQKNSLLTD